MLYLRLSLGFLALSAHLLLFASAYTINVGPATSALLTPGQTLTYTITLESGDTVVLVDILFVNGNLGNTTNIALNSDLSKAADRTGDYLIPSVPPGKLYSVRLVNASTKELLKDSTTFEVFAPGSTSITSEYATTFVSPFSFFLMACVVPVHCLLRAFQQQVRRRHQAHLQQDLQIKI
ncbi:hypothetical protein BDN70DRAFT_379373 [Pholiota conissans]|uniref:Translocon-associated protein subunit beta n=1 Tax=Pholiota conissans TaxID=109636 RepID=A0A9P5Z7G7_9AGAR|nr:hypothetical protein BDN70DRAFT_379373 [Pholiota conissans]